VKRELGVIPKRARRCNGEPSAVRPLLNIITSDEIKGEGGTLAVNLSQKTCLRQFELAWMMESPR